MTAQELAQKILNIAQKALDEELKDAVFIDGDPGTCAARSGLEDIIKCCQEQRFPQITSSIDGGGYTGQPPRSIS